MEARIRMAAYWAVFFRASCITIILKWSDLRTHADRPSHIARIVQKFRSPPNMGQQRFSKPRRFLRRASSGSSATIQVAAILSNTIFAVFVKNTVVFPCLCSVASIRMRVSRHGTSYWSSPTTAPKNMIEFQPLVPAARPMSGSSLPTCAPFEGNINSNMT